MSFEGSLGAFGMTEIFQLIASQAKTGVLEIEGEEGVTRVRFVHGQLLDAFPAKLDPNKSIGAMLVSSGMITPKQLEYALQTQQRTLRRLGDILIRMGAVRTTDFQNLLALQRREMAFSLLRMKRGRYSFLSRAVEYEKGVDTLLNVDAILMEGSRQLDEWPSILERIPLDTLIYRRIDDVSPPRALQPDEAAIFGLTDVPRSVREYINAGCIGEFRAWDALAALYDMGLIEQVRHKKSEPVVEKKRPLAKALRPTTRDMLLGVLLIVLGLGALVMTGFHTDWRPGMAVESAREAAADIERMNRRANEWAVRRPGAWPKPTAPTPSSP